MAFLLDDLFLFPVRFPFWLARKLSDIAREEMTDDSRIHEDLLHLQMRFEMEEIDEPTYDREERRLMERLDAIRKLKEQGP